MNNYEEGKILYIKLVSGEELLGEFLCEDPDINSAIFKNMILLQLAPNEQGQVGVQMLPFPFTVSENQSLSINKNAIAIFSEPNQDFINAYNQRYGSGIEVVTNPGILHS